MTTIAHNANIRGCWTHHAASGFSIVHICTKAKSQRSNQLNVQAVHRREGELQDQMHSCNATLAQTKREKEELGFTLQERSSQLADLQREAADKKRALDSECDKLSREKHKRQRIEEDNKVRVAAVHTADLPQPHCSCLK